MDGTTYTDDPETMDEEYERLRFESMTPWQQEMYMRQIEDQFEAVPSYVSRDLSKED
jgi:hypothetical protein